MLRYILLFILVLGFNGGMVPAHATAPRLEPPNKEEWQLFQLINAYRKSHGLSAIPFSKSLTQVAKIHVQDLNVSHPSGQCNMHSWSIKGTWSPCCYTADHAQAKCMWNKPRELTRYKGHGYENAYGAFGATVTATGALEGWKHSSGHNAVILNQGIWNDNKWQSMGLALDGNYAVLWFGVETDPDGYWGQETVQSNESTGLQAFLGTWDTKYGQLKLWQDGDIIRGTYAYDEREGQVSLVYRNQKLEGTWQEYDQNEESFTGQVVFQIQDNQLQGRWNVDGQDEWYDDWLGTLAQSEGAG